MVLYRWLLFFKSLIPTYFLQLCKAKNVCAPEARFSKTHQIVLVKRDVHEALNSQCSKNIKTKH